MDKANMYLTDNDNATIIGNSNEITSEVLKVTHSFRNKEQILILYIIECNDPEIPCV